jgi:hypothetical protein
MASRSNRQDDHRWLQARREGRRSSYFRGVIRAGKLAWIVLRLWDLVDHD